MAGEQRAANCRWARPTLFLHYPFWLDAWDWPWCCEREGTPRMMATTEACLTCPQWECRPAPQLPRDSGMKTSAGGDR
jgi:hypothetical protein